MPKGMMSPGLTAAPVSVVKMVADTKPVAPAQNIPKEEVPKAPQQTVTAAFSKSPHSITELTISERTIKNVLILKLEGKLTRSRGTAALLDAIRGSLSEGKKNILVDLKGITFVDDGALGELIARKAAAETDGGKVKMLDPSEAFQSASMIMEFLNAYSTYDNEDEALASFH